MFRCLICLRILSGCLAIVARFAAAGLLSLCVFVNVFAEIRIDGVSGDALKNIKSHISLEREPCDAPEWKVRRLFSKAKDEIGTALEVYGFYGPTVTKTLKIDGECWSAQITIDPGPAVLLKTVTVEVRGPGQLDERFQAILRKNPLRPGEPLNHVQYERYKTEIAELANRRGYFDATYLTSQIVVYADQTTADITLVFSTGERYRFGPIRIEQDVVDPRLIEKYIDFVQGTPYDASLISQLYESLLISDYFNTLDIRTAPKAAPEREVEVTIRATESKARTFTTGIGFGTDTGPKLRAGYSNRRRNKSGHQSGVNASVSQIISEIGLSYRLPLGNPRAEWLNLDAGYRYEDTDTSRSKQAKFGVKRLKQRGSRWLETQFVDVAYEDFKVGETKGTSFLLIPGISWSKSVSDEPARPKRGHRLNLQISGTAEEIGSSVDFFQGDLFGKIVRPLWSSARVMVRAETGFTLTSNFTDLPASRRYFAGGDFSVRGYDYESLGPRDSAGNVIGGKNRLAGSVELDQRVAEKWSVAAFADAGNAFDDFDDINLKFAVGTGVRWYSPLGPIRFDIAIPLAADAPDSFRIHVTLGPDL